MEKKRMVVGVERKKVKKSKRKRKGKGLLRNAIHYLKSDSYMYAPLLSLPPNRLPHPNSGKLVSEPKNRDAKRLVDRVVDYLKSDCYLYASLIVPRATPSPTTGPSQNVKRVSVGDSSAKMVHQPTNKTDVVANEKRTMKGFLDEQTLGCRGTVEDMVYLNRHYSSVSGA